MCVCFHTYTGDECWCYCWCYILSWFSYSPVPILLPWDFIFVIYFWYITYPLNCIVSLRDILIMYLWLFLGQRPWHSTSSDNSISDYSTGSGHPTLGGICNKSWELSGSWYCQLPCLLLASFLCQLGVYWVSAGKAYVLMAWILFLPCSWLVRICLALWGYLNSLLLSVSPLPPGSHVIRILIAVL